MNQRYLLATLVLAALLTPLLAALPVQSQADALAPLQRGEKQTAAIHSRQQHLDEGERIFKQNCSRCHTAPEGFSPSISGTIVRHMRARASLSQRDEQKLLHFFNP